MSDPRQGGISEWIAAGAGLMFGMLLFKLLFTIAVLGFIGFWWWTEDIKSPKLRQIMRGIVITGMVLVVLLVFLVGLT